MKIKAPLFDIKIDILFLIVMFIFLLYSKLRIFFSSFFVCYLFIVFHEASHMLVASIFGKSIESFNISLFGVSITFKSEHYSISNKITDRGTCIKNILIYFCGFVIVFFIAPAICTVTPPQKTEEVIANANPSSENVTNEQSNSNSDTGSKRTIKLLHSSTGEVEELGLDEYLYGVVSSEMPANFEIEALKAQAVVARTYTIYQATYNKNKHQDADICDSYACCQAWISKEERMAKWDSGEAESNWNKIVNAVDSTSDKIIAYNGKPINVFFHANSGGTTESSLNIWGGIDYPYLKSVETAGEDGYTQYSSEAKFSKEEISQKMKEKYADFEIDYGQEDCIKILEYTTSGRVKTLKIGNKEIAGTEARTILGLKSTNFSVAIEGNEIKFSVTGYGHGVGMSQTGAESMAKSGADYQAIIKHFYTGVEIIELNSL